MPADRSRRPASFLVLCASLVLVTVLFGVRVKYADVAYYALAILQFALICIASWKVGAWAIRVDAERRRLLAVSGSLLIAPWALFSFLPGIGPPGDQTAAENELRYLILLVNAIAIAVGLVVLREALGSVGERLYATLGGAAIVIATPLYVVWATIAVEYFRTRQAMGPGQAPAAIITLVKLADVFLFFGGALTYAATAALAASLGHVQWLGRSAALVFVAVSLLALLCLMVRGLWFPDPKMVFEHWYAIPGYVVGIPAVPWIVPTMLGVALLRRAGAG